MPLTALSMRNDVWMDGVQVNAQDLRLEQTSALLTAASPSGTTGIAARPGVRYAPGSPLLVTASSGMTLGVAAGVAWVQGSAAANAGVYTGCLDTAGTVTLATSDPTNPRIDNIIVQVTDNGNNTSTTVVTPQTGTPAPSPVAPTVPSNSLLLAQVAVGAGVSTINSGNITDKRVYSASNGGITVMTNTTSGISGPAGLYVDDLSTGRLRRSDGAGNAVSPKIGPFNAVTNTFAALSLGANGSGTSSFFNFQVDGNTELEFSIKVNTIQQATPHVGDNYSIGLMLDGVVVDGSVNIYQLIGSGSNNYPFMWRIWAKPPAGNHNFAVNYSSTGTQSWTTSSPVGRIAPVIG